MTFDPAKLGPASRTAWELLQARTASGEWFCWIDLVAEMADASGVTAKTASNLCHADVATGRLERRGRHPDRFVRLARHDRTASSMPNDLGSRLANRLEGLGIVGPAEVMTRQLATGEAILDWLTQDVLPDVDLVTSAGKPTPWLRQLTNVVSDQMRAATAAATLGVEERRVAVEEAQLLDIVAAMEAVLRKRGIEPGGDVRADLAIELRALDVASAPLAVGEQSAS